MTNYEDMSLDELKALKEQKEKEKIISDLKAEEEAEEAQKLELHDAEVAETAIQSYINNLDVETPSVAKDEDSPSNTNYIDDFKQTVSYGNHEITFTGEDIKDIQSMYKEFGVDGSWEYGQPGMPENHINDAQFNFTAGTDNGCDESSQLDNNWSIQRHFCNVIWHAKECHGNLGRVCASVCDIGAGQNARLDIKVISARSDPNSVSACTCLSCASNTFDRYSITLNQLGDYAVLCSWDEFQVGSSYRRAVIKSMAQHWGVYFDAQIPYT